MRKVALFLAVVLGVSLAAPLSAHADAHGQIVKVKVAVKKTVAKVKVESEPQGQYKVPHFDGKGASDHFFTDLGLPVTLLRTSFYWDNFIHFGLGPKKGADGKYAITFPMGDKKLPGIAVQDIGKCAHGIFAAGDAYIGKTVAIAGEHLTGAQMAAVFSKTLGVEVVYHDVPPAVYRSFGFPGADDMGNMFQYKRDFEAQYCGARDLAQTRKLNPELQTFSQWAAVNAANIPLL